MPKFFTALDKIRPAYDLTYKAVMFLCKLLLIADILIASYAVLGRFCQQWSRNYAFLGFLSVIKDPAWTEQVVLTCMSYMAVLSAALAIRTGAHIRMTAFDAYLPKKVVKVLDVVADVAVMALGVIMVVEGWKYATTLGGKGFYESIPWLSRFWMYFPVPLAGIAMIVFELEALYNHIKSFYVKEEEVQV
ncbi:MAG: TRAP transporter small permease subunit [Dysosmobacter sp.]|nr:TRAP transporter small permease subunit [Dysosmobacter sp.]